jgi:hypothetical protein
MRRKQIVSILVGTLSGSPVLAQEGAGAPPNPCTVEPIFHCAQPMKDGSIIGHFGYGVSCPESDTPPEDLFIQIGEDNFFTPAPIDRGQPKVFTPGKHVDEFEVEFSAEEVKKAKEIAWTVLKVKTSADLSKTKDASLDCNSLPKASRVHSQDGQPRKEDHSAQ